MTTFALWRERLLIYETMYFWTNLLPLAVSRQKSKGLPLDKALGDLEGLVQGLAPDLQSWYRENKEDCLRSCSDEDQAFAAFLHRHEGIPDIDALWAEWQTEHQPTAYDEFLFLLRRCLKAIDGALSALPSGPGKARDVLRAYIEWSVRESDQIYDAMVLLVDETPRTLVAKEVAKWKQALRQHQKEVEGSPFEASGIFWRSLDNNGVIDAVSRYRLMERFQIGEFPDTAREIEYLVGTDLLNGLSGIETEFNVFRGDQQLLQCSVALFLASRSPALCARTRNFVEIALVRLAHQQFAPGWYVDYIHTMEQAGKTVSVPNVLLTALAAVCLLRLGRQQYQRDHALKAVQWLATQQRVGGYWVKLADGQDTEPDLLTTVAALEAIRLSGANGMEHSLALGDEWLLSAQLPTGEWQGKAPWPPFPYETVLVLEYLGRNRTIGAALSNYLQLAKGFLDRSAELALEDDPNAWRLSLVTAYQGLEALLYGLLTHPSINAEIFKKKNETIGARAALDKLEEALRAKGNLAAGQQLPNKSSLLRLAHLRDEVVHKAIGITGEECRELQAHLQPFVGQVSPLVLGYAFL